MVETAPPVRFEVTAGLARVTLARPEAGNAINVALAEALVDALKRCDLDPAVRCVLMTGTGRLFCAGGDLNVMRAGGDRLPATLADMITPLHSAATLLAALRKPVVTLVNGPAAGAGMSLALLGDFVLAARSAHFTPAYAAIGLTADGGLSRLLPRLVGLRRAQEILLANRRVGADEAERIGMITRVVDDATLATEGAALAEQLRDGPTRALGATRALLDHAFEGSLAGHLAAEFTSMVEAAAPGGEASEGIAAFAARRRPEFKSV